MLLVGGSATVATAWITQKMLDEREIVRAEIRTRETLYGELVRECSKLVMDRLRAPWISRRDCCPCMGCSIAFGFARPTRSLRRRNRSRDAHPWDAPEHSGDEEMKCLQKTDWGRPSKINVQRVSKFHCIFTPALDGLYELSFPMTGDHKKAEQCFVTASKTVLLEVKRRPALFI